MQLRFHHVCGNNIRISGCCATRIQSFCKGIVFSDRPIYAYESIVIKICEEETDLGWKGALRVGFTNIDPEELRSTLPEQACPEFLDQAGFWIQRLYDEDCAANNVLEFLLQANGDVHFFLNGIYTELLLRGVNSTVPLWLLLDIYGRTKSVELMDKDAAPLVAIQDSVGGSSMFSSLSSSAVKQRASDSPNKLNNVCVVCLVERRTTTLYKCGHACMCMPCANKQRETYGSCPLCRAPIVDIVQLYFT